MMSLIQMSLYGSVMILIIMILRRFSLPKRLFPWLWCAAGMRMLLPFSVRIKLPTAVRSTAALIETVPTDAAAEQTVSVSILPTIWLTGVIICGAFFAVTYIVYIRRFRFAVKANINAEHYYLHRKISIKISDRIDSPLTYGIFRPVIILPKNMAKDALKFVITHETVHIRRFDTVKKLIFIAATCVHWFNPLAWIMLELANRDIELACDDEVVRIFGIGSRSSYAITLIDMEESRKVPFFSGFTMCASEERIRSIMKHKTTTKTAAALAVAVLICIVTVFAITPFGGISDIMQYSGISYAQLKSMTGTSAEHYHSNFYISPILGSNLTAVLSASGFDEEQMIPILKDSDRIVRIEGGFDELVPNFNESMVLSRTESTGAGTAYYIADSYSQLTLDTDSDGAQDMIIYVRPDGHAWCVFS